MPGDQQLICSECGQEFTFSSVDQAFFQKRGYSTPKRCRARRQKAKTDPGGGYHEKEFGRNHGDMFHMWQASNDPV